MCPPLFPQSVSVQKNSREKKEGGWCLTPPLMNF